MTKSKQAAQAWQVYCTDLRPGAWYGVDFRFGFEAGFVAALELAETNGETK